MSKPPTKGVALKTDPTVPDEDRIKWRENMELELEVAGAILALCCLVGALVTFVSYTPIAWGW